MEGGLFISKTFEKGGLYLYWVGRLILEGGFFNSVKMVVSVFHKELECKLEKLKYKKLEVTQPRIKNNSEFLTLE